MAVEKVRRAQRGLRDLRRALPLCPTLEGGQVVIMDDLLQAHKGKRVGKMIEERGASVLLLPAYSPDFDPIVEEAFSKIIKGFL